MLLVLLDAVIVFFSFGMAYQLRFDFRLFIHENIPYQIQFKHIVFALIIIRILLFKFFRLYKGITRYVGITDLLSIFYSTIIGTLILCIFNMASEHINTLNGLPLSSNKRHLLRIPWSVIVSEFMVTFLLIAGTRFAVRLLVRARQHLPVKNNRRVLIMGAGDLGEMVAREMLKYPEHGFMPVAFIDEDLSKKGSRIHNLQVLGDTKNLAANIENYKIDDIVIAIPNASPKKLSDLVEECRKAKISFRIVPSVADIVGGKVSMSKIRSVEIEDLLGRDEIKLTLRDEQNYVRHKRVLITGAGGSIGSELCNQIITLNPASMVLLGKGENSIYEIATSLKMRYPDFAPRIYEVIGDVRDLDKLHSAFKKFQPEIVFHAAAHKHVPLMELHPDEAMLVNVFGTYNLATLSDQFKAAKFVLISTDKAVRPTSVMGASKRVAEMIISSLAQISQTEFLSVRFGNVLGSRGSVIPLFKKQIEQGGPITVTHKDVKRYFMTIPEAVSLVIQAGAIGKRGELFVLDMGKPVRIYDLALNLITLSGLEPFVDIDVVVTGLRPGEKLFEEILTDGENVKSTCFGKIFITHNEIKSWDEIKGMVERLREASKRFDNVEIVAGLKKAIPDFNHQ